MIMKTLRVIPIVILAIVFGVFTSCNNEPVDEDLLDIDPTLFSNFQVDFDGETYKADAASASIKAGLITITAFRGAGGKETFSIIVKGDKLGTYTFGREGDKVGSTAEYNQPAATGGTVKWATVNEDKLQGNISIDKIDAENGTISGRFNFVGTASDGVTKEFTNGVFENLKADGTTPGDGGPASNKFVAKVDGADYTVKSIEAKLLDLGIAKGIQVIGNKNEDKTESISLIFPDDVVVGKGKFTSSNTPPTAIYILGNTNYQGVGDFIIEIHDTTKKRLKGIFNFVGTNSDKSKEITSGSFDVYYK